MIVLETNSEIDREKIRFQSALQIMVIDIIHENTFKKCLNFSYLLAYKINNLYIKKTTPVHPATTAIFLYFRIHILQLLRIVYKEFEKKIDDHILNNKINDVMSKFIKVLR
jgi:hypothetical protein